MVYILALIHFFISSTDGMRPIDLISPSIPNPGVPVIPASNIWSIFWILTISA